MNAHQHTRRRTAAAAAVALVAALSVAACGASQETELSATRTIPQPTHGQLVAAGLDKLPLAPARRRVDIVAPTFSHPTRITNPLFPVSRLESVVFSGRLGRLPFHTEVTLLPETRLIEWSPGRTVRARVSQYFAYVGGRIEEVALDYYAQADDGSVWYLGEDVHDYDRRGFVDSTLGSWLAGREGPPEMIMPADPHPGDVHRAENIPAIAFEEVTIKRTGRTVAGPRGPVAGAMVASELHDDGTLSDKVFAPGYGEFFTSDKGELEALALSVPTDALPGPVPPELRTVSRAAASVIGATRRRHWNAAAAGLRTASAAWAAHRAGQVPPRLAAELDRALRTLTRAVGRHAQARAGSAAIDVAQSALDLQLRFRPQTDVDLRRFELWAEQVRVDAAAGRVGGVRGDTTTMEWIRDRFAHRLRPADRTAVDAHLTIRRGPRSWRGRQAGGPASPSAVAAARQGAGLTVPRARVSSGAP